MEAKHTPGPWHFGCASREIHADGKNIARVLPGMFCGSHVAGVEEQPANARLIATAPELLEALEELVDLLSDEDRALDSFSLDPARAAIRKAKGE